MGGGPIHFKTFYSILDSKRLSAHSQTQVDGDRTPKSGIFVSLDVVGVCRARTWRVSIGAPPRARLGCSAPWRLNADPYSLPSSRRLHRRRRPAHPGRIGIARVVKGRLLLRRRSGCRHPAATRWRAWFSKAIAPVLILMCAPMPGLAADEMQDVDAARPTIKIGWTKKAPTIDGHFSPEEWSDAAHVDGLTQARPDPGVAPTQRTEVWIMTDEDHLYVAARLWDTNPEEIVRHVMLRDADLRKDDRFGFTLDPFLDRQNGYFFQVNANGSRRDFLFEGGGFEPSWDGRWYAQASVDDEGWIVEFAIPYATISFDPEGNVWGFNMARGIRRRSEIDRWADPVLERFLTSMGRAGNLVGMKGVSQGVGLQVAPSGTLRRVDDVNQIEEGDDRERHYTRADPSLDVFYKVTPSITTALTVNTDFGESEVDARRVNLTRFSLRFPEKRDFFLQDTLIFNFANLNRNGQPFFSRKIGLNSVGEPEGITAGGKITGRTGRFKFGILDVVLDKHDQVDAENVLVARGAMNIGESTLGAIVTNGDPSAMGTNTLIGADYNYRNTNFMAGQSLYASAWVQNSFSNPDRAFEDDDSAITGSGLSYGAKVEFPNDKYRWLVSVEVLDGDFNPALGFANRVGIRDYNAGFRRRWRPNSSVLLTVDTGIAGRLVTGTSSEVKSGLVSWTVADLANSVGDAVRFRYLHLFEFVETDFSNLSISNGRYHSDEGDIRFTLSKNRRLGGEIAVGAGTFFDGSRTRASADLIYRFSRFVQTSVVYRVDDIRLPDGDELIQVLGVRLSLLFTPNLSWITLVQYDNNTDSIDVNSRLRWIIEDGREFFLVVNQGLDSSDGLSAGRTAPLVKLQWTFRF